MTDAERNWLAHLGHTLADLGSEARQRRYKAAVPFVHVPIELAAQCDAYVHLLERESYRALFDATEIDALIAFFAKVRDFVAPDVIPDIDDGVLDDQSWREIMAAAGELHRRLLTAGRIPPAAR